MMGLQLEKWQCGEGNEERHKICLPLSVLAEVFFPLVRGENTTLTLRENTKDCHLLYGSLISADTYSYTLDYEDSRCQGITARKPVAFPDNMGFFRVGAFECSYLCRQGSGPLCSSANPKVNLSHPNSSSLAWLQI